METWGRETSQLLAKLIDVYHRTWEYKEVFPILHSMLHHQRIPSQYKQYSKRGILSKLKTGKKTSNRAHFGHMLLSNLYLLKWNLEKGQYEKPQKISKLVEKQIELSLSLPK